MLAAILATSAVVSALAPAKPVKPVDVKILKTVIAKYPRINEIAPCFIALDSKDYCTEKAFNMHRHKIGEYFDILRESKQCKALFQPRLIEYCDPSPQPVPKPQPQPVAKPQPQPVAKSQPQPVEEPYPAGDYNHRRRNRRRKYVDVEARDEICGKLPRGEDDDCRRKIISNIQLGRFYDIEALDKICDKLPRGEDDDCRRKIIHSLATSDQTNITALDKICDKLPRGEDDDCRRKILN